MLQNFEITATFIISDYTEESQLYALAGGLIDFSQVADAAHLEYGIQ